MYSEKVRRRWSVNTDSSRRSHEYAFLLFGIVLFCKNRMLYLEVFFQEMKAAEMNDDVFE